jgi:hypothetical protein
MTSAALAIVLPFITRWAIRRSATLMSPSKES